VGSSFSFISVNQGLSVFYVFKMCSIEYGDGLLSHVWMPVSTLSITIQDHGLSSFTILICCVFFVSRCVIDSVYSLRSVAVWPSDTISIQFPIRLHVIPEILMFALANMSVFFMLFVICVLSFWLLIRGRFKYSSQQNCLNVFNLWKNALILHEINFGKF
jgi:hypothetical protein